MRHSFEWVQASLDIIVALGLTRIVTSIVQLHALRRTTRLDWIPLAWAITTFFLLLQFSWVFVSLRDVVARWTFGLFLCLLGCVLMLFTAAALVLPSSQEQAGDDLRMWFRSDGRSALHFLGLYSLLAYPFNWYFTHDGPASNPASALMLVPATIAFLATTRRLQAGVAALTILLTVAIVMEMCLTS
jgi:hypothetical protein